MIITLCILVLVYLMMGKPVDELLRAVEEHGLEIQVRSALG